ncbi:hypothetical protein [Chryseolinea soli]|uniref:Uncharacterized protein n=1 Tax=Chryseolinea soli TaxID=2321403 RepID=A0A385SHT8_9BACT|nr:hypothetical protein [Chryseolinea soli]AYB29485.1 hypothetical protein D4L85_02305 [Chryseolinea soli]
MKPTLSFIAAIVLLAACHRGKEQSSETSVEGGPQPGCYAFHEGGSSIELQLAVNGDAASGDLLYSLEEKDKNTGTIRGTVRGNMLDAYYTFTSEGVTSVREVIFQWVDNSLVEGIGEHIERNDTSFYADKKKVTFTDSKVALKKCE